MNRTFQYYADKAEAHLKCVTQSNDVNAAIAALYIELAKAAPKEQVTR